jgi:His-Xaa-Ser system radical SAM maturase HxsC
MLTLRKNGAQVSRGENSTPPRIFRLTTDPDRPIPLRKSEGFISRDGGMPAGFAWYAVIGPHSSNPIPSASSAVFLSDTFNYLGDGDILRVGIDRGDVDVLFQKNARHHTFLLTERCNHYCLMCSQPPRDVNDSWIVDDVLAAIPLIERSTPEILFTGGEPTLLGPKLLELVRQAKSYLPETGLHILSNGRRFKDNSYTQQFADIGHHDLMFGIPVYSDQPERHDYIVQADGAFDETVRGILNLKRNGLRVEVRVVVHKQSYERLAQLSRFIARNLTFVDQVVFMGLEMTGFTKANLNDLWIDPVEYQTQLAEAVHLLSDNRIHTAIYNHQLCITDASLWEFAKKSISDWKNEYMPECEGCSVMTSCGGFFASAKVRYSTKIKPIPSTDNLRIR